MRWIFMFAAAGAPALAPAGEAEPAGAREPTVLGVREGLFTLKGEPVFLLGVSYYGALGAADGVIGKDLDEMQRRGFSWIRVWATWAAYGNDVSAVEAASGGPREPFLSKLKRLVQECDRRGMVVDVTLSRGNGFSGPPRLQGLEPHLAAVRSIAGAFRPRARPDLPRELHAPAAGPPGTADLDVPPGRRRACAAGSAARAGRPPVRGGPGGLGALAA